MYRPRGYGRTHEGKATAMEPLDMLAMEPPEIAAPEWKPLAWLLAWLVVALVASRWSVSPSDTVATVVLYSMRTVRAAHFGTRKHEKTGNPRELVASRSLVSATVSPT